MEIYKNMIGERIKKLRKENGLTQEELSIKLGLNNKSSISQYEKGDIIPSDEVKLKMCKLFNCTLDYLMGKSDYRNAWEEYDATHDIEKIKQEVKEIENNNIEQEFKFAYHKEMEGLTDKEIIDALRFYKQIKYGDKDNK